MRREGRIATLERPAHVQDLLFREVDRIPDLSTMHNGDLLSLSLSLRTSDLTHGLHRFPAKFIPQIPRWAIAQFLPRGGRVLDPFCGSGTTLVEARQFNSTFGVGIEIDPLTRLIASAKANPPSARRLANLASRLDRSLPSAQEDLPLPMPGVDNFEHWFTRDSWSKLHRLRDGILGLKASDAEIRFLLAVLSSVVRRVSNADDQSQKTYVSGTLPKKPPEALNTFRKALERAIRGVEEFEERCSSNSSAEVTAAGEGGTLPHQSGSIDLIVTSPPYLDSVDYPYNLMLENFWIGPLIGVPDRDHFNLLRRRQLGAKNPTGRVQLPESLQTRIDPETLPASRRNAASAYFHGIDRHFSEAARVLAHGARYVLVVGNSQTSEKIIPIHDAMTLLAAGHGLELEKAFAYRIRRHYMKFPRGGRGGIILLDWVIVLRRIEGAADLPAPLPLPWATLGSSDVAH